MSQSPSQTAPPFDDSSGLANLVLGIPPARRGALLQSVVSFRSNPTLDDCFEVGPLRVAFANFWEDRCGFPVPIERLRLVLEPPVPIGTVLQFSKLMLARDRTEMEATLGELVEHLKRRLSELRSYYESGMAPLKLADPAKRRALAKYVRRW